MYGDYHSTDDAAMDRFARELQCTQRHTTADGPIASPQNASAPHVHSAGSPESQSYNSSTGSILTTTLSAPSNEESLGTLPPSQNDETTSATATGQCAPASNPNEQFFELCINTGELSIKLGEINISRVTNDRELFRAISTKYREIRGFRIRRILLKPRNIHFVLVSSLQRTFSFASR